MSSEALGLDVDFDLVIEAGYVGDVGVPHSAELLAFTNAVELGTPDLDTARRKLSDRVGPDALLEAAATIAIFNGLVRVADGTGIQLDGGVFAVSAADRSRLGIDSFAGAANSEHSSPLDQPGTLSIGELFGDLHATRN